MARIRVGILYGGRSGEHEISVQSARSVIAALDRRKYEPILIGIDPEGHWHRQSEEEFAEFSRTQTTTSQDAVGGEHRPRTLLPRVPSAAEQVIVPAAPCGGQFLILKDGRPADRFQVDVVFPVLHGPFGEDGTVQGLLELAGVPFVGSGVLGSAIGIDKDLQKRLFQQAGLPVVPYLAARAWEWAENPSEIIRRASALGYPLFVKPARLGSSIGVTRVERASEFSAAVNTALEYGEKIVIEAGLDAREIECAILGNERPAASVPGEVIPHHAFYSYEAKYLDESGASFRVPAEIPPATAREVQRMAVAAFLTAECEGMARVDFFLERRTGQIYINEVNTIPGFTRISQYPRLWEASGLAFDALVDRLISLALERHARRLARARRSS